MMKMMHCAGRVTSFSRQIIMAMILSVLLASPAAFAAQNAERTGVVDFGKIMQQMPETKQAETTLQATAAPLQKEFERLKLDFEKAVAAYKQQAATMTKAARDQKEKELNVKGQAVQKYQQDKFGRGGVVDKKELELIAPIRQKALGAVQTIAQKEGFTLVIDKSVLVYGAAEQDLTFKVMNQLNIK
ncbi:OmpH family outer membrane protein [Chlorobium limicola]|uniref:OmpH family outer membrane protein n=1 Tax=Chlorobium limicola TaxID=1092 RepID=UPI0030B84516